MTKVIKRIEEIKVQENENFSEVYLRSGKSENTTESEISVKELPVQGDLEDEWDVIREAVLVKGSKHFALIKYEICSYSYNKELGCELIDGLRTIGSQWEPLD